MWRNKQITLWGAKNPKRDFGGLGRFSLFLVGHVSEKQIPIISNKLGAI
jgi:hypothetical protein